MVTILAHRGLWRHLDEANSGPAFERAFSLGFGVETDIRDCLGDLVVAHDPVREAEVPFDMFLRIHRDYGTGRLLALNIKADGLQALLKRKLEEYSVGDYFLFDMSVPEAVRCVKVGLTVFTRQSELEEHPSFYEIASGVWMDSFFRDWISEPEISSHIVRGKRVCIVSPELHGRPHEALWEKVKDMSMHHDIAICTDFPVEAKEYFRG